jgi:hypothetical protein
METLKSERSSEIADKFLVNNELPIVGKIKFLGLGGEVAETKYYTNSDEYLATIKKEIDYMDGFKTYTNPNYPELRKTVDDIFYSNCGSENPHSLEWYTGNLTIYNDESEGFKVEINLTKNQQSELASIESKLQDLKNLGVDDISLFSYDYKTDLYTDAEIQSHHEILDIPEISDKTGLNNIKESFHPDSFNSEHVIQRGTMKTTESIDSLLNRVQDKSIFLDYELCSKPGITEDEISTLNNGLDKLLEKTKANNPSLTQNIKSKAKEIPVLEKQTSFSQMLFEKPTLPADLSIKKNYNNPSEYLGQFIRKGKFDFKNFEIFSNDNFYLTGDFKFISENGIKVPKFDSLTLTNRVTHKQCDCMQILNKLNENNVDILKLNPSHFEQLFSKNSLNLTDIKGKELFTKSLTDKPFNISITRVGGKMFGFTNKIMNAFSKLNQAVMG